VLLLSRTERHCQALMNHRVFHSGLVVWVRDDLSQSDSLRWVVSLSEDACAPQSRPGRVAVIMYIMDVCVRVSERLY